LFLEAVAIIFMCVTGHRCFALGDSNAQSPFYTTVVMVAISYIVVAAFSILLLIKNKSEIDHNDSYKFQAIFGLIPGINLITVYWSIKILRIKNVELVDTPTL
jgi:hypothetical protein